MAIGLKCWDPAGNLVVGVGTRLFRMVGTYSPTSASGSITVEDAGPGTLFAIILPPNNDVARTAMTTSTSGTTLSWNFPNGFTAGYSIMYGYF